MNKQTLLNELEESFFAKEQGRDKFRLGDTIEVHYQIKEIKRERTQIFEGVVIEIHGSGVNKNFTIRETYWNIGTEMVFPLHSPKIQRIKLVRQGRVRRAKLYYLRDRVGKAAQVPALITNKKKAQTKKAKTVQKKVTNQKSNKK